MSPLPVSCWEVILRHPILEVLDMVDLQAPSDSSFPSLSSLALARPRRLRLKEFIWSQICSQEHVVRLLLDLDPEIDSLYLELTPEISTGPVPRISSHPVGSVTIDLFGCWSISTWPLPFHTPGWIGRLLSNVSDPAFVNVKGRSSDMPFRGLSGQGGLLQESGSGSIQLNLLEKLRDVVEDVELWFEDRGGVKDTVGMALCWNYESDGDIALPEVARALEGWFLSDVIVAFPQLDMLLLQAWPSCVSLTHCSST